MGRTVERDGRNGDVIGSGKGEDASVVQIMLEGTSTARKEVGISHVRWVVERRREENEVMMKEESMRDGVRKRVFRDDSGLDATLDFGKHVERMLKEVYLQDLQLLQLGSEAAEPGDGYLEVL